MAKPRSNLQAQSSRVVAPRLFVSDRFVLTALSPNERTLIDWMSRNKVHGFSVDQRRKRRRLSTSRASSRQNAEGASIVVRAAAFKRIATDFKLICWTHEASPRNAAAHAGEILWLNAKGRRIAASIAV